MNEPSVLVKLVVITVLAMASWLIVGGTALLVWRVFLRPFGALIGAFEVGE